MEARNGFSVLEALVAVTLLSTATLLMFDILSNIRRTTDRVELINRSVPIARTAFNLIPNSCYGEQCDDDRTGQFVVNGWEVVWSTEPASEPFLAGSEMGLSAHILQLELITVTVRYQNFQKSYVREQIFTQRLFLDAESILTD